MYFYNLVLILTNNCNLRCIYCYEGECGGWFKGSSDMTEEMIEKALKLTLDKVPVGIKEPTGHASLRSGVLSVYFWGGEPLLRKDLITSAKRIGNVLTDGSAKKISWRISTNGVLIDDNAIELLKDVDVYWSIDDNGPIQNRTRKTPDSLMKQKMWRKLDNVICCVVYYPPVGSNQLLCQVQSLIDEGFRRFHISHARGFGWSLEDYDVFGNMWEELIKWHLMGKISLTNTDDYIKDLDCCVSKVWTGDKLSVAVNTNGVFYPSDLEAFMNVAPFGTVDKIDENELNRIAFLKSYRADKWDLCNGCIVKAHCHAYGCILYYLTQGETVNKYYLDECREMRSRWRAIHRVVRGMDWDYEIHPSLADAYGQMQ